MTWVAMLTSVDYWTGVVTGLAMASPWLWSYYVRSTPEKNR